MAETISAEFLPKPTWDPEIIGLRQGRVSSQIFSFSLMTILEIEKELEKIMIDSCVLMGPKK